MADNDNRYKLWQTISKEYDLPDYNQFSKDMEDATKRKSLHDAVSAEYELPDFDQFSKDMGYETQTSQQGNQNAQNAKKPQQTVQSSHVEEGRGLPSDNGYSKQKTAFDKATEQAWNKLAQKGGIKWTIEGHPEVKMVAVTDDLVKRFPQLEQSRGYQVPFNMNTGTPIMQNIDDKGNIITPDEASEQYTKILTNQDFDYVPKQETAAVQIGSVVNTALSTKGGWLDQAVQKAMEENYGKDWKNRKYVSDGKEISSSEIYAKAKQGIYDNINGVLGDIRKSLLFSTDEQRRQTVDELYQKGYLKEDFLPKANALHYISNVDKGEQVEELRQRRLKLQVQREMVMDKLKQIPQPDHAENMAEFYARRANDGSELYASDLRKIDKQIAQYNAAIDELEGRNNLKNEWGHAVQTSGITGIGAWDFGVTDMKDAMMMYPLAKKMQNGENITQDDFMSLKLLAQANEADAVENTVMPSSYNMFKSSLQSVPFTVQFLAGGEFAKGATTVIDKAATRTVKGAILKAGGKKALKAAEKVAEKAADSKILKFCGMLGKDFRQAFVMENTTGAATTGAEILNRHIGTVSETNDGFKMEGESLPTAIIKGEISQNIESQTEFLGEHFPSSLKFIRGMAHTKVGSAMGLRNLAAWLTKVSRTEFATTLKSYATKAGINGVLGEYLEEVAGTAENALLVGDQKFSDLLDVKQQEEVAGSVALSCLGMGIFGTAIYTGQRGLNMPTYYRLKHLQNKWDNAGLDLFTGEEWAKLKDRIDNTPNEGMKSVMADILKADNMTEEQARAAFNYARCSLTLRGMNLGAMKAAQLGLTDDRHIEQDNAYVEGRQAKDEDKHDIQIEFEDRSHELAEKLGISEQQLDNMSDEDLESLTGKDDQLDNLIYDYQTSHARYQGVVDNADDEIDKAAQEAARQTDMATDKSRGTVRNATIKATKGEEDYGVYIVSGNVATNEDGSINVSESDDMILYYDPKSGKIEHCDAMRLTALGEEVNAEETRNQAIADAKDKAIRKQAGIIDGTVGEGTSFTITDEEGNEHTYEVLADNGDGSAMITMDGNVQDIPVSLQDLQNLKDAEEAKRLEAAKMLRQQYEEEREKQNAPVEDNLNYADIINTNDNVEIAEVVDEEGNAMFPDAEEVFFVQNQGSRAKVMVLDSEGNLQPKLVKKSSVRTLGTMSVDEYRQGRQQALKEAENASEPSLVDEAEPSNNVVPTDNVVTDNTTTDETQPGNEAEVTKSDETQNISNEQENTPKITLEDGTEVPMLEDGNPDFSQLTAGQVAELYDSQFGDDAEQIVSGNVNKAKKALDKANGMTVSGGSFAEQKASKEAKDKAIAEAKEKYDSAKAIEDAYNERMLAKEEDKLADMPFEAPSPDEDAPFSAKDKAKDPLEVWNNMTDEEKAAYIENNRVKDTRLVDDVVGKKLRKAIEKIAEMMGATVQWQRTDMIRNGWFNPNTKTIYLALDSSILEGVQFVFGHEMTHEIKSKSPVMYDELKGLVKEKYGEELFEAMTNDNEKRYAGVGKTDNDRSYYEEETVADAIGDMINDLNLTHSIALKMSHPLLAKMHDVLLKIKNAFTGTPYTEDVNGIIRTIEMAYVKTANREAVNTATQEGDINYVIFKPEDMQIVEHEKFSVKSKPVRFEIGKKLSDEEKKEVLSTLKDAYKVNGVPYHIEETAGGKEKRVYEPTSDSYVVSDITNRPLRYYITLPDGRVAHPTEIYPNISDNEVKSSATKQGLLDDEADQIVSVAIGNMKGIADNAKAVEVLTELQNLPHETHDIGYGLNNAQSYNYKTGIFTSDAAQAIDYVVRRMRRKEDVPAEIPAALKKAVANSYGMVDNLIDGMSNRKLKPFADYADITSKTNMDTAPSSFEEFLEHPAVRYSIRNEKERAAAEDAYNFAQENRPDRYSRYAIVNMEKPGAVPQYLEKKAVADNWRRYYNRLKWGNYKLFDLDKPFEDNVKNLVGKFPETFRKKNDTTLSKINELTADYNKRKEEYDTMSNSIQELLNGLMKQGRSLSEAESVIRDWGLYKEMDSKYQNLMGIRKQLNELRSGKVADRVMKDLLDGVDPRKIGETKDGGAQFSETINSGDNIRFSLKEEKEKIVADAKANGTYMTAPNGEKTKLNAEQWVTVRTTNFKKWFGDWENDPENASKVVDENGEPMVVWHGRSAEFNTFEKKEGVRFIMGLEDKVKAEGFFFSPNKGLAEEFASNSYRHRGGKANVIPCFLNIRKPMDLTREDYDRIYEDVTGWDYIVGMDTQDNLWGIMDEEGMADKIKEKGYDGVFFVEEVDDSYEPTKISYCALDANQIKSADNNNGDFSADNNDIRFSLKSMMEKPEGWKQANKKAIHIAEAIERDPKFSLKNLDGTLIKAGTYFSGGGLVEEGLKGIIDPVVAVEYDEKISGVYRNNFGNHIVTADVRDVDPKELVGKIDGGVEYFHASPVCKNYSLAKNNHEELELDKETAASTAEFISKVRPKVVTIENVKGYKDSEAMKTITDALDEAGYKWDADVYNAADYGGYTNRERLIVRAVRDGELPAKPKKQKRKSGWYEAVEDIMPTLTEKKNGVAPWMDERLKADGIDWRHIDKPLYVMGSGYANGTVPHAFADELLPTLRTKSGDVIVMPDGKVYRAMGRVLARVSGVSDDYQMPASEALSHTIIGNGIPTQLTENVIAPLVRDVLHPEVEEKASLKDAEYLEAVRSGDMEKAQKMVYDAARAAGYVNGTDYQGEGSWNAPSASVEKKDFANLDALRESVEEYSGDTNVYGIINGVTTNDDDFYYNPGRVGFRDAAASETSSVLRRLRYDKADANTKVKVYRTVPADVKGNNLMSGDWIALSKQYCIEHGNGRYGEGGYRIIEEEVPIKTIWNDGNDMREFGFDDGNNNEAEKNVPNNRKLLDAVTYDNNGNVIPLSERFNESNDDIRYSLRVDRYRDELNQWKKDNNLPKDAERPQLPVREPNESAADFLKRVKEYRKQAALWATAPTYEDHLLTSDTAQGQFNLEMQRKAVLTRIVIQDSMLAIRKAQEAIMKEKGVDKLNPAEDAYTAENRSHGKAKNEFEEYNDEFLQPLRKAYNELMQRLGKSYDNVKVYMIAKHGLERNAYIAFKYALDEDYETNEERMNAYNNYKADMDRLNNDADFEAGRIDFAAWKQRDGFIRTKYAPSYFKFRFDENGMTKDYSGLSALFDADDYEGAAADLVKEVEDANSYYTDELWYATNDATKKILRDSYNAGMMTEDNFNFVSGMYRNYIPLRGWGDTNADQVWNYVGGGKGAFNQVVKEAKGRKSLADDPIAYIENMAESAILMNNRNWVKQHLLLLAQNYRTSLLNVSKAWYIKTKDAQGNQEWIPASPQITEGMTGKQVEAALEAFEQKMEQMKQNGEATQKREHLEISYPQTNGEEREHEVRVMKGGEEYVIYVNGDPQLAQAVNNTRARKVREGIEESRPQRILARTGRYMAAAYTSMSPLFIPSNYMRDLTMTLASTAIREDARYNYLLRRNMLRHWNTFPMLLSYQNGTLREKVRNGSASRVEQMFYDFMVNGGETGFVTSVDVEDLKKKFRNDLKDLNRMVANPKKVGHIIMNSIETLNRAIEDSNRFMVYMTSIEYGRSIEEAVNNAKDVTLNFNRKGTGEHGWQAVRDMYLFINPAVQSLQTLGALAKHHPFKFTAVTTGWLATGLLVPMLNNLLMSFFGGDDDKDKYWQFTKWDRRNNFIMWIPFTKEFVKIPLAQEFRGFYGVGDMIASKLWGGEKAEESWGDYALDLAGQIVDMLPLDPTGYDGNIGLALTPNAARPIGELALNVDFTGKPIFKNSEYNKYDPNFTKAYVGTPDWLVRISKMVNSIDNKYPDVEQNAIDRFGDPKFNPNNPAVIDHLLSSYLGGSYTMGSQIIGVATKALNGDDIKMADIPLASKFVSNPDDRPVSKKQGEEFWDMKERHDRAANTLSKLKKKAKVDGDYSTLDIFFGSDEYRQYKEDDKKVKKYEEDRKKEKAQETGEEYRPHKTTADDVYKSHTTPKDDFEDMKMKQLYEKLNSYKIRYEAIDGISSEKGDAYYKANKAAIDAIEEIAYDKSQIASIKKGFLSDGQNTYDADGMKDIRELRKRILDVLEKANKAMMNNRK